MTYAIISDIHGNMAALDAVLEDAAKMRVEAYIFVGDYCSAFHYPNEVIDKMKTLSPVIAIQGNEDAILSEYAKQDPNTWTDGQFQSHYWLYKNLSDINHAYVRCLPGKISFKDGDISITITHKSSDLYGDIEYKEFFSTNVAQRYRNDSSYTRNKLVTDIQTYMHTDTDYQTAIQALSDGVYIFGHTHLQWHAQYKNKLFINPGSCGLPLDMTAGAPYTILHIEGKHTRIVERRVQYDTASFLFSFKHSDLYKAATVWSGVITETATKQLECAMSFLELADHYAKSIHDTARPFTIKTWTAAYALWKRIY